MASAVEKYHISIIPFGPGAILVTWPPRIEEGILEDIILFGRVIADRLEKACEQVPAYHSLLLVFDEAVNTAEISDRLSGLYGSMDRKPLERRLWRIPVCYHPGFAPDMALLSERKGISPEEIVKRHTRATYTVYGIGFLPGFMYLGGLDESLVTPRRNEPRQKVSRGAVGIGGRQTGIYPQQSPGGWNIIGNSPVQLFDPLKKKPCPVGIADKVRFYEISREEHELLEIEVSAGVHKLKNEKWYD
ncbi:5-oxoprolinase subunit PxpB [Sinomicrobium soli]|uniref:5-oxoprolinase subunit PxpB n=1 Tax=Sinomicrobium sp. N-1-3-6 TaxID=2219864 RepID=UPI000DCB0512|nr:5-oxoprolinase subunit PxpB [Sinomicrobium sp. N-1-3-6]RAV29294.1 allophanate hydrolase subunit 1 [Sinomicrobium sp. N-1-3-6]